MAKKEQESYEIEGVFSTLDQTAIQSEKFFEKHAKTIAIVFGSLVILALGYVAYQNFIITPKNTEASESLLEAQKLFEQEKYDAAVGGKAGSVTGFADIAQEYNGTKSADLASLYAGICKFKLGKYQEALTFLEKFDTSDKDLLAIKYGAMGDTYAELNNDTEALNFLIKASEVSENSTTCIQFTKKAAIYAFSINQNEKALELLKKVNEKYPDADPTGEIDAYIQRLTYTTQK